MEKFLHKVTPSFMSQRYDHSEKPKWCASKSDRLSNYILKAVHDIGLLLFLSLIQYQKGIYFVNHSLLKLHKHLSLLLLTTSKIKKDHKDTSGGIK